MSLVTRFCHHVMRVVNLFWTSCQHGVAFFNSCHHVMNVWFSVKLCSRDRQFTYPVLGVASSLIIYICYTYCVVVFRCVFKRGIDSRMLPTFWVCRNTSHVPSGGCILGFGLKDHFFAPVLFWSFCGTLGLRGLPFYNSGILLLFVQCFVDCRLGVRLSL